VERAPGAIVDALVEQQDELSGLLEMMDGADWERPSRCEGWTVADVVVHLAQTNELAAASVGGRFPDAVAELTGGLGRAGSIDEGADLMVRRERDQPPTAIAERWRTGADELDRLLRDCDPHARVAWVAGELSARTLATTRLAETWIHTGDVAAGLGKTLLPTDRLWHIARLAWRTLPYAFSRAGRALTGPVAFELRGTDGAAWDFTPEPVAVTTIRGDAVSLCLVAARRLEPRNTDLRGEGPDAEAVLELVRTYA